MNVRNNNKKLLLASGIVESILSSGDKKKIDNLIQVMQKYGLKICDYVEEGPWTGKKQ